ncbi:MAG: UPF0280 family protein [Dehalococcoidia bacterium]|nr:UPF0280 family protein [Dehalococcoidia bacterium]
MIPFETVVKETDMYIRAEYNLHSKSAERTREYRTQIERYIEHHPVFLSSMVPLPMDDAAPCIVRDMLEAGNLAGVGPMAAVAGAIAENVGVDLLEDSAEIIVENGGDIFLRVSRKRLIGVYAGDSPLSGKFVLEIFPEDTPLGVCTSSGTVGHSKSFGRADAAIVLAASTSLADAAATAIGNLVKGEDGISRAIEFAQGIKDLAGVVVIMGDVMGIWGKVKISPVVTR